MSLETPVKTFAYLIRGQIGQQIRHFFPDMWPSCEEAMKIQHTEHNAVDCFPLDLLFCVKINVFIEPLLVGFLVLKAKALLGILDKT